MTLLKHPVMGKLNLAASTHLNLQPSISVLKLASSLMAASCLLSDLLRMRMRLAVHVQHSASGNLRVHGRGVQVLMPKLNRDGLASGLLL
jgi:hypothetical protein